MGKRLTGGTGLSAKERKKKKETAAWAAAGEGVSGLQGRWVE
jgi:hypothetical protein